jgi:hypothetical protein
MRWGCLLLLSVVLAVAAGLYVGRNAASYASHLVNPWSTGSAAGQPVVPALSTLARSCLDGRG